MPKHLNWVTHYEKGKYDLAILHVDQQCLLSDLGKSVLFKEVRKQITDIPIIVVNHGTPTYPERFNQCAKEAGMGESEQAGIEWARKEMKKLLEGIDAMVVNSYQAAEEWGWGIPIIHGLDPDEWWDSPKEPRIVTFISPGGMGNKYYGRLLFGETRNILREKYGMELVWIGEEKQCKNWDDYRDFLGRSLIYFNPTFGSPMPRTRTESLMSGCCVVTTKYHDADKFIKDGVNGFLIKNNPEDAAKRLAWCMEHYKECIEIGKRGRKTAIEKFHISRFKNEWMELINKVLTKNNE